MEAENESAPYAYTGASYDPLRGRMAFLRDSYWGGERYRNPSATTLSQATAWRTEVSDDGRTASIPVSFRSYLVPHPKESDEDFRVRLRLTPYVNLVQPIVDAYAEAVTANVKRDLKSLDLEDVDCRGSEWGEFVETAARFAGLYGFVFGVVDTPSGPPASSLAEEKARGIKPRCILVEPASLAWVDVDSLGRLCELAYVEQAYQEDAQGVRFQRVRIRRLTPGQWELREATLPLGAAIGSSRSAFATTAAGALPAQLNGQLPVHVLYYRRVPTPHPLGQSLVEDAADISRGIYNALSWANETHRKAGFPFLAVPLASTGGQMDVETKRSIGPSKAFPYDSAAGAPQWIQPSAESTSELRNHCAWLFQMALRTAGLEVAADSSAQVQSGEALRIRSRDFEARAARFARNCERWERKMLADYQALAGSSDEISVTYPKVFTLPDPSEELANAATLLGLQVEIGPKAKALAVVQASRAALNLPDDRVAEVLSEVSEIYQADLDEFDEERKSRSILRALQSKSGVNDGTADRTTTDGADSLTSGVATDGSADG